MDKLARKVDIHHAAMQGSYFAGFSAIWGFGPVLLLYLAVRLSLYIFKIIGAILCVACGVAGGYLAQTLLNPVMRARLPENAQYLAPVISGAAGFLLCYGIAAAVMMMVRKPAQPMPNRKE